MIKNKKRGFTLAEILITLGVIGVIAAITIPQIVNYTTKSKIEGNLARAVEQIELGMQNVIQTANNNNTDGSYFNDLSQITVYDVLQSDGNCAYNTGESQLTTSFNLFCNGASFMNVIEEKVQTTANNYYKTTDTGFNHGSVNLFYSKDSQAYIMYSAQKWTAVDNIFTFIAIDANGSSKPNKKGRDIFAFGIDYSGKLIPAGTKRLKKFTPSELGTVPLAKDGCKDGNFSNGWSCTARVVADGFRINYW